MVIERYSQVVRRGAQAALRHSLRRRARAATRGRGRADRPAGGPAEPGDGARHGGLAARSVLQRCQRPALEQALDDEEEQIRHAAITALERQGLARNVRRISPLLYDPVRAVRMEAARTLAAVPPDQLQPPAIMPVFERALEEYEQAGTYSADFPEGQYNLANLSTTWGGRKTPSATSAAPSTSTRPSTPPRSTWPCCSTSWGATTRRPSCCGMPWPPNPIPRWCTTTSACCWPRWSSSTRRPGLLEQAADGMPGHTRVLYNLGLVEQRLGRPVKAAAAIDRALALEPQNGEFLYTAAWLASQRLDFDAAETFARRMTAQPTTRAQGQELLAAIARARRADGPGPGR